MSEKLQETSEALLLVRQGHDYDFHLTGESDNYGPEDEDDDDYRGRLEDMIHELNTALADGYDNFTDLYWAIEADHEVLQLVRAQYGDIIGLIENFDAAVNSSPIQKQCDLSAPCTSKLQAARTYRT